MERKVALRRTAIARRLRRDMTDAERALWGRLRLGRLGVKFRRQMPIGRFIADFASLGAKLVIEVDGGQHDAARRSEHERTVALEAAGFFVLRFWNNDVLGNIDGVLGEITRAIAAAKSRNAPQ
jgi:very-short-patch-repair endonuclease